MPQPFTLTNFDLTFVMSFSGDCNKHSSEFLEGFNNERLPVAFKIGRTQGFLTPFCVLTISCFVSQLSNNFFGGRPLLLGVDGANSQSSLLDERQLLCNLRIPFDSFLFFQNFEVEGDARDAFVALVAQLPCGEGLSTE